MVFAGALSGSLEGKAYYSCSQECKKVSSTTTGKGSCMRLKVLGGKGVSPEPLQF
jgi:hypothetical protein